MTTTRKQRWGALLLAAVVASLAVMTVTAAPVEVQEKTEESSGPLSWLFNWPVSRLGVADAAEDQTVEEGRRRKDSSAKYNSKKKTTKRQPSGGSGSHGGGGGGYYGHGSYGKPTPTTKKPGPGHATEFPPLNGKPIHVGGTVVSSYPQHSQTQRPHQSQSSYTSWLNPLSYLPSWNLPSWSFSHSSSFDASVGDTQGGHVGSYTTPEEEYQYERPETSKSEVMVIQFPGFVRTIGQGIRNFNNAIQGLGEQIGDNLYNNFNINQLPNNVGHGVAAIFPLEDPNSDDPYNGFYTPSFPHPPPLPVPDLSSFPVPSLPQFTLPPLPSPPTFNFNTGGASIQHSSDVSFSNSGSLNIGSNTGATIGKGVSSRDADGGDAAANKEA